MTRRTNLRVVLLVALAAALAAGELRAQGGEWPTLTGAGIEYLSDSGFLQVSFSGQLDLEAMNVGGDAWGGLIGHSSNKETPPTDWMDCSYCHQGLDYNSRKGSVVAHRLRLFTDIFLGDHVYSLVEVRSDRGHAPSNGGIKVRVEQAYLRLATANGGVGLQVGRFASPFGSYALRHLSVIDPFLRPPLPYEYRTVLPRRHVPENVWGVLSWKDWPSLFRAPGSPPVWDVPYQAGAMAFGSLGPLDLRLAAMGSAPSSDPQDWGFEIDRFRKPSWVVGARSKLHPSLEVGASYSRGPWMEPPLGGTIPAPDSYDDFAQEIVSADLAYNRGAMMFRAEAMLDHWEMPTVDERLRDLSYSVELQWDVRAGVSAAARWGMVDFRPLAPAPGLPAIDWDRDVHRIEGSLGYRLVRNAGVMLSAYQQNVRDAEGTFLVGLRLWYAF